MAHQPVPSLAPPVPTPRVRPRFKVRTELSIDQIESRLRAKLEGARGKIVGVFVPDRVELVPHPAKAHFWSPQLSLEFSEGDDGTLICARFGPHPPVWTLYMGIHAVGAFSTLGAAIFGMSQHMAGESPWALWALPVSPLLAALVWALAFIGQNLGAEQMYMLRKFLDESLDDDAVPDETAE